MFEIGRVCIKTSGKEAGKMCVIVDKSKDNFIIDGNVKRKGCNPNHLEPTKYRIDIKKGATRATIAKKMEKLGFEILPKKKKKSKKK